MTCAFIILELNGPGPNGQCPGDNRCKRFMGDGRTYHYRQWSPVNDCHVLWVHPFTQAEGNDAKKRALAQCPLSINIAANEVRVCPGNDTLPFWEGTPDWDFLAILGHHMFFAENPIQTPLLQNVQVVAGGNRIHEIPNVPRLNRELTWSFGHFHLQEEAQIENRYRILLAGLDNVAESLRQAFGNNATLRGELIQLIQGRFK